MSDIKSLVIKNELALPEERVRSILDDFNSRKISFLSPEKEAGPFLLYCCGDSLEDIALKTNYPMDILILTALQYRWGEKSRMLGMTDKETAPKELQKDLLNTILIATVITAKKELADVIAGRATGKSNLIPNSIQSLQKLIETIGKVHEQPKESGDTGKTVINGNNIQINQTVSSVSLDSSGVQESKVERLRKVRLRKAQNGN